MVGKPGCLWEGYPENQAQEGEGADDGDITAGSWNHFNGNSPAIFATHACLSTKESSCPPALGPVMLGLVFLSQRQGLMPLCTNRNITPFNPVPKTKELQTIDFSVRVIDDLHGRTQHSKQPNSEFGLAQMASDLILFDTTDYKGFFSGVNPSRRSCTWTRSRPP